MPRIVADIAASRQGTACLIVVKTPQVIAHDSLRRAFAGCEPLASLPPELGLAQGTDMEFHVFRHPGS
ncbi:MULTISPECIES: hypothetical protein [unclassified Nonomuraea]|uniref:hypothetical protein n=1 Tax=Nonomuraea sp. NPDC047529 TaxID=3155623 RepID=UPI0033CDBD2F